MSWMKFLINPKSVEVVEMEENEELKKAWEVYEDINADEHERYLAELRIKYILDLEDIREKGLQEGYQQGIEEGREQGIHQGMEQGMQQGEKAKAIEIVTEMLKEGFEIEKIAKLTGLREYEIAELDKYEAAILKNEK